MKIRSIIIDDEQNNIDNLSILIEKHCPEIAVEGTATTAEQGKELISRVDPGIVFLDIQMPGTNGFDLLRSLTHYSFEIIFVTAYDQYGIQAIRFSAIDYLLKPVHIDELQAAVKRAVDKALLKQQNTQLENLVQLLKQQQNREEHRIALTTLKETRFLHTNEIIRCESMNNYTTFYLTDKTKIIVSRPIYEYEELLAGYGFIRSHQSHLVNKKHIKSLLKDDGYFLLLQDGTEVPVSRNKKESLKKLLEN